MSEQDYWLEETKRLRTERDQARALIDQAVSAGRGIGRAAERTRCMGICRARARAAVRLYHETGDDEYLVRKSEAICCEQAIAEVE